MTYNAKDIILNELDSGEELVWAGTPKQGIVFKGSDILMIPFSLMWGGFAIFWEFLALSGPKDDAIGIIFPLFGIPFVIIGLYMIFGRFFYDSKVRAKTFYGLTNQRVIIMSGLFKKHVKSLNLKTLSDVSLTEKTDGSGSIIFGQENQMMSYFGGNSFPAMAGAQTPKFELIKDAKKVYNLLRENQN